MLINIFYQETYFLFVLFNEKINRYSFLKELYKKMEDIDYLKLKI
jgi:hypothetical protein